MGEFWKELTLILVVSCLMVVEWSGERNTLPSETSFISTQSMRRPSGRHDFLDTAPTVKSVSTGEPTIDRIK